MRTATRAKVDIAVRDEWLRTIQNLKSQIKMWVNQDNAWHFTWQEDRQVEERHLGRYAVEVWRLETPEGEVRLEPIARNYPGRGIVELYAWPTLRRVRLIQDEGENWKVLTDSGIFLREDWNRNNFITLVQDLISAG